MGITIGPFNPWVVLSIKCMGQSNPGERRIKRVPEYVFLTLMSLNECNMKDEVA
jgi:hypothetical protein